MARKIGILQESTVSEVQGGVVHVVHMAGRRRCLACAGRNNISITSNHVIDPTTNSTDVNSNLGNMNADVIMNNRDHINARNTTEMSNIENLHVDSLNAGTVNSSINNNDAQNQFSASANDNTEVNYFTGQVMNTNVEDQDESRRRRLRTALHITLLIHYVTNTIFL